jgi:hypothetical protein
MPLPRVKFEREKKLYFFFQRNCLCWVYIIFKKNLVYYSRQIFTCFECILLYLSIHFLLNGFFWLYLLSYLFLILSSLILSSASYNGELVKELFFTIDALVALRGPKLRFTKQE